MGREVEDYASNVSEQGEYAWNNYNLQNLGDLGDGELLRLYVDAKSKAEEFQKAHENFLSYVEESKDYDFVR